MISEIPKIKNSEKSETCLQCQESRLGGSETKPLPTDPQMAGSNPGRGARNPIWRRLITEKAKDKRDMTILKREFALDEIQMVYTHITRHKYISTDW